MGKIQYKIDILAAMKEKGWSTYKILQVPPEQRPFGQSTVTKLKHGGPISFANLAVLCRLLDCQPGDLLEYVPDEPAKDHPPAD